MYDCTNYNNNNQASSKYAKAADQMYNYLKLTEFFTAWKLKYYIDLGQLKSVAPWPGFSVPD